MRVIRLPTLTACALALCAIAPVALAQSTQDNALDTFDVNTASEVSMMPGWVTEDGSYMAAIRIELSEGWKTYWRASDGAGIPPAFDWSGSENLERVAYYWPTPNVYWAQGIRAIGYADELILPVRFYPESPDAQIDLALNVDYGICREVCVPARANIAFDLPQSGQSNIETITQAINANPRPGADHGLNAHSCNISQAGEDYVLSADFAFSDDLDALEAVLVESGNDEVWISTVDYVDNDSAVSLEADLVYFGEGTFAFDQNALRFTFLTRNGGIDIRGC
jgi:DsbC/DsbD-like thiol-disulfide interchange protein